MFYVSKNELAAYSKRGGIASEEPLASSAGIRILLKGGNAADASVAVSLALAVTVPHLGGVGGDFFALVRDPGGKIFAVNGSGYAPSGLREDLVKSKGYDEVPPTGPLSPVVPGLVDGLRVLHERFGSLEWKELVEPAKEMAKEGFPAPPSLAKAIRSSRKLLECDEGSRRTYLPGGEVFEGKLVKFSGLGKLLEEISEDPRSFYEGNIAEKIVNYVNRKGGVFDIKDFKYFKAYITEPLESTYRDWHIWEVPPNSQGLTTLILLKLLENEVANDNRSMALKLIEASKVAYSIRDKFLGDPRYMETDVNKIMSKDFLDSLKGGGFNLKKSYTEGDTTFFTVVDKDGMIVAGIQSLFYAFGSGITEPSYQVTLNSRAQAFTLYKGVPNSLEPLKRPLHTLSAVIMKREERLISFGLSGGNLRPQLHALIISNIVDRGMNIAQAISASRYAWIPYSRNIVADENLIKELAIDKFKVTVGRTGVAAALEVRDNIRILATDPRGDGYPYVI